MTANFAGWQHQFIETNDIRLHCVTQGEGELIILLHGFFEFWYSWRRQIPALSRDFKVVVPDLRGYNDSDKPQTGYDLDTLSADIRGLVKSLGYEKAHIIGHDWGGAIAWHMAQTMPSVLDHLVIMSAPHPQQFQRAFLNNVDQLRRSWYVLASQLPGLPEAVLQQNLGQVIRFWFQEQVVRKGAFTKDDAKIYQAALEKPGALSAAINHYRQFLSLPNWVKNLGSRANLAIEAPTLVLWGQDDNLLSQRLLNDLDRLTAVSLERKLLPDCGHWVQKEVPQTVNRELLAFLTA